MEDMKSKGGNSGLYYAEPQNEEETVFVASQGSENWRGGERPCNGGCSVHLGSVAHWRRVGSR